MFQERKEMESGDSLSTLIAASKYAFTFYLQNQFGEAQKIYESVIKESQRIGESKHPSILQAKHNYASCSLRMKHFREAEQLFKEVIGERE